MFVSTLPLSYCELNKNVCLNKIYVPIYINVDDKRNLDALNKHIL